MLIMEDTLKQLGHIHTKTNEGFSISRPYYDINISKNEITHDSMHVHEVNDIKINYQKNFQIHERTIRGETFEVIETKDEIVITVH